jgi:hypothetical protein
VSDDQTQNGIAVKARPQPENNRESPAGQSGYCLKPKESRLRPVAAGPTESPHKRKQEASLGDNPMTAFQDDDKQTMKDTVSSKGFDFSLATANVRAYQAKLAEVAQANVQFAFEYAQRLATIRSPVEILNVIAEFTSKRIAMLQKYSIEMVELDTKR